MRFLDLCQDVQRAHFSRLRTQELDQHVEVFSPVCKIRQDEGKISGTVSRLVQYLTYVIETVIEGGQYCRGTQGGGFYARNQVGNTDRISMGEKQCFIQADHLAAVPQDSGEIIPCEWAYVYFASSIKYR